MKKITVKSLLLLALLVCTSATVSAAPWSSLGSKRVPHTLVITGNYQSPRLLAELVQNEANQSYILVPTTKDDNRYFICYPDGTAQQILEANLNRFIRVLNPRRIIVLGNENYTPSKTIKSLDRTIPVIRIEGTSWNRVAEELTFLLNLSNLNKNFRKLNSTLQEENGAIYRTEGTQSANSIPRANYTPAKAATK
jgi:hypothetical protein